jgi:hypothetical protein
MLKCLLLHLNSNQKVQQIPWHFDNVNIKLLLLLFFIILKFLVSAQLESLYICISLDYLMTLQDFFISGLPSAGNETRSRTSTLAFERELSTKSDSEKNQQKVPRPSTGFQKPSIPSLKRIKFSTAYYFFYRKNSHCF